MNGKILKYNKTIFEIINLQKQLFLIEEDESLFNDIWDLFENNSLQISMHTSKFGIVIYYKLIMLLVKFAINHNPEKIDLYIFPNP